MTKIAIVGTHQTQFGNFSSETDRSLSVLMNEAGLGALSDSTLSAADVDGIWVGACSPGSFNLQDHLAPLAIECAPTDLRFKPAHFSSAACASSSIALYDAIYAIQSGRFQTALVIGVEKMLARTTSEITDILAQCSYWEEEGAKGITFPGLFAEYAKRYREYFDISQADFRTYLAHVSARAYRLGAKNPLAQFGPGALPEKKGLLTAEAILALPTEGKGANVMIADPLRLHDCSLISDGAAALLITTEDCARELNRPYVTIEGMANVCDRLPIEPRRDSLYELTAGKMAIKQALAEACVEINQLETIEVHDCFTIAQLLATEALGLSEAGCAGPDYQAGRFDEHDNVSVNLSGGLKSKGHPVGATGAAMHVHIARQLLGNAPGVVRKTTPEYGLVYNMGGAGVTNCVTILKRQG